MKITRDYRYQEKTYHAFITKRRTRSLKMHLDKDGNIILSVPMLSSMRSVDEFVIKSLPKLLKKLSAFDEDIDENGYYLFGQYIESSLSKEKIKAYLKKELKAYLEERVLYYEVLMGISPFYNVLVRDMSTRYGVNSKATHRLSFALSLAHYSYPIIDAIIVHELAHHFQRNHQKAFYDIVYQYCPNYDILHKKLRKHIHA